MISTRRFFDQHLVVLAAHRALFAVADHVELGRARARGGERTLHRVAATLAKTEVVLARTALVGIAFERDARIGELAQVFGVARDLRLELRLDLGLVQIEVHHALAQARVGVEAVTGVAAGRRDRLRFGHDRRFGLGRLDGLLRTRGNARDEQNRKRDTNGVVHGCDASGSMMGGWALARTTSVNTGRRPTAPAARNENLTSMFSAA